MTCSYTAATSAASRVSASPANAASSPARAAVNRDRTVAISEASHSLRRSSALARKDWLRASVVK